MPGIMQRPRGADPVVAGWRAGRHARSLVSFIVSQSVSGARGLLRSFLAHPAAHRGAFRPFEVRVAVQRPGTTRLGPRGST